MSTLTTLLAAATSRLDVLGLSWPAMVGPDVRIEQRRDGDRYVLRAELPGVDPARDVRLSVTDSEVRLHVERTATHADKGRSEFRYGSFDRTVALPAGVQTDTVTALYTDGILEVSAIVGDPVPAAKAIAIAVDDGCR